MKSQSPCLPKSLKHVESDRARRVGSQDHGDQWWDREHGRACGRSERSGPRNDSVQGQRPAKVVDVGSARFELDLDITSVGDALERDEALIESGHVDRSLLGQEDDVGRDRIAERQDGRTVATCECTRHKDWVVSAHRHPPHRKEISERTEGQVAETLALQSLHRKTGWSVEHVDPARFANHRSCPNRQRSISLPFPNSQTL